MSNEHKLFRYKNDGGKKEWWKIKISSLSSLGKRESIETLLKNDTCIQGHQKSFAHKYGKGKSHVPCELSGLLGYWH